jgi:hypothetical protein
MANMQLVEEIVRTVTSRVVKDSSMLFANLGTFSKHMGDIAKHTTASIIHVKMAESLEAADDELTAMGKGSTSPEDKAITMGVRRSLNERAAESLRALAAAAETAARIYENRSKA